MYLATHISNDCLMHFSKHFEDLGYPVECIHVTNAGKEKLKKEFPDIWKEFGLDSLDVAK